MPSSASTRLRFEVQALGENLNSWGDTRLNEALRRIEEGIAGLTTKAITGNVTLTSSNYVADEARNAVLKLTGTPGATYKVTIPSVEKLYFVINATDATQNIGTSGGTAAAVRSGQRTWVHCDGTDTLVADPTLDTIRAAAATVVLGSQKITSTATPTTADDLTRKGYVDAQDAIVLAATADEAAAAAASAVAADASADAAAASAVAADASADAAAASAAAAAVFDPSSYLLIATKATASDLRTGTDNTKYITSQAIRDAMAFVTLTDAATIAVDMATGFNFSVTLGGNRTLGAPTNSIAGQSGLILVIQDGTGSRTLSYASAWKFAGGAPTASTAASTVDAIAYTVTTGGGSPIIRATYIKAFA